MARTTGFLSQSSGKLDGQFQTRQTDHGTFLARLPRQTSKARRSEKQANTRCQMANAAANYGLYNERLKEAFEGKNAGVSDFNAFIQVNYGRRARAAVVCWVTISTVAARCLPSARRCRAASW